MAQNVERARVGEIKTIDMTPTWTGLMPALLAVLEDGTEKGKKEARAELMRLAAAVDRANKNKVEAH